MEHVYIKEKRCLSSSKAHLEGFTAMHFFLSLFFQTIPQSPVFHVDDLHLSVSYVYLLRLMATAPKDSLLDS